MVLIRLLIGIAAVFWLSPAQAQDKTPPKPAQAQIPFADHGGIQDWRAIDDKGLYVRGQNRQWYYATLFSSCFGLKVANGVAFVTSPGGAFDKFSAILVENSRCPVVSL